MEKTTRKRVLAEVAKPLFFFFYEKYKQHTKSELTKERSKQEEGPPTDKPIVTVRATKQDLPKREPNVFSVGMH